MNHAEYVNVIMPHQQSGYDASYVLASGTLSSSEKGLGSRAETSSHRIHKDAWIVKGPVSIEVSRITKEAWLLRDNYNLY